MTEMTKSGVVKIAIFTVVAICVYFAVTNSFRDTSSQWRSSHFYNAYLVDDRRLQSIDESTSAVKQTSDDTGKTGEVAVDNVETNTAIAKKKSESIDTDDSIYYRTAVLYTVENRGGVSVRITSIQECGNKKAAVMRIGDLELTLKKTTINSGCPWFFAPKCKMVGYFAMAAITSSASQTVPLPSPLPPFAELYDYKNDKWKPLELIDGRSSPVHPHKLAVCLQPIYLMADWPLIPNFFETWIGNGATLFYIYVHSISKEIDVLIKMYEAQKGIEVIRVNWPALPTVYGDDDLLNPNNRLYRTEVVTAVNDCILRARSSADLVVSSDLDEIIAPLGKDGRKETLLQIIDDHRLRKTKQKTMPGAFIFLNSFAYAENDWSTITHPRQISFKHYASVDIENKVWTRGRRSKVIYIPDRIFRAHVHEVVAMESKKWGAVVIDENRARVLHFRQVMSGAMNRSAVSKSRTVLAEASAEWQTAWEARLEEAMQQSQSVVSSKGNVTLATEKWDNLGSKVLKEIEECRDKNTLVKEQRCETVWSCRSKMQIIPAGDWVEPDSDKYWTVI